MKSVLCMLVGERMYNAINTRPEKWKRIIVRSSTLKKGFELFQIYSFADTSWADDKNSRKTSCCYLVFVHNAAFSWCSFMFPIVAMSTSDVPKKGSLSLAPVRFNFVGN